MKTHEAESNGAMQCLHKEALWSLWLGRGTKRCWIAIAGPTSNHQDQT
jgi:hypothetical protein